MTHPIVKYAEEVTLYIKENLPNLSYHLANVLFVKPYFKSLKSINIHFYFEKQHAP